MLIEVWLSFAVSAVSVEPLFLLYRVAEGAMSCVVAYERVRNASTVSGVSRLKTRHQRTL